MLRNTLFLLLSITLPLWAQEASKPRVLTLNQCLEMALGKSPELVKARSTRTMGSASLQSSASSLLPKLSVSSSYTQSGPARGLGYDAFGNLISSEGGHSNNYRTTINASQSLVNLSQWAGFKASVNEFQAASAAYRQSIASLSYRVKEAYFNLMKLQKALEVAKASVEQSQEQAVKTRLMHQLGSISRSDLLKIEVRLAQNRVSLLEAQKALSAGREALRSLINYQGDFEIDTLITRPDSSQTILNRDSLLAMALAQNPGLRAAQERYQASRDYLWSAWLAKLPSLGASYSYGYSDSVQFKDSHTWNQHDSWTFSISLNWNIFDGTATEAQIRKASAQAAAAEADFILAKQNLISQVEQVYIEWQAAREELSLVDDLLQQADEDFRLTTEKYRLGAASTLDLLASQVNYNQSQQQAVNALCSFYIARAKVDQILGRP